MFDTAALTSRSQVKRIEKSEKNYNNNNISVFVNDDLKKQNKSTRLYLEFHNLLLDGFQIRAHRWHWIQFALQNIHPVKHTLHTGLETIVSERTKLGAQGVKFQTEFQVMPWILQLVCLADKLENYTQRKWKKTRNKPWGYMPMRWRSAKRRFKLV